MKPLALILLYCLLFTTPIRAQLIKVEDFAQMKKSVLRKEKLSVSKQYALLDLYTNEKGFVFKLKGIDMVAEEGDGMQTVPLPHHTSFLIIEHPDYGQLVWKIPGKGLKKKKRYRAYLYTEDPKKEFKPDKQWVVFRIRPEHAIVFVDSTVQLMQDGLLQLYLPVGQHTYQVISPFYEDYTDTFELTDSTRLEKQIELNPFYAYLTVNSPFPDAEILLDGKLIGCHRAETGRIMPGQYRLTVRHDSLFYHDAFIEVGNTERKVVDILPDTKPFLFPVMDQKTKEALPNEPLALTSDTFQAGGQESTELIRLRAINAQSVPSEVSIHAFDEETEIWLNREKVGVGHWDGVLSPGFYAISTRKKGLESKTFYCWVEAGKKMELNMASPQADYGMLNVSCNKVDAEVFLNGLPVGKTPCILYYLPVGHTYEVCLFKNGKRAEKKILLKGNDMVHVHLKLKD